MKSKKPKTKRLGNIDIEIWNKLNTRATLETTHKGCRISVTDIVLRAIEKEIKSFKLLIQK